MYDCHPLEKCGPQASKWGINHFEDRAPVGASLLIDRHAINDVASNSAWQASKPVFSVEMAGGESPVCGVIVESSVFVETGGVVTNSSRFAVSEDDTKPACLSQRLHPFLSAGRLFMSLLCGCCRCCQIQHHHASVTSRGFDRRSRRNV